MIYDYPYIYPEEREGILNRRIQELFPLNTPEGITNAYTAYQTNRRINQGILNTPYPFIPSVLNSKTPLEKINIPEGENNKMDWGGTMQAVGGVAANVMPRKVYDDLDPIFHLAGGRHSAVGNGISDVGVSLFKSGAASGNPQLMLAGGIAKAAGGLINAGFGYNIENEQAVKDNIGKLASVKFNARDMDTLASQYGSANMTKMSLGGVKNGWFNRTGTKKANELSTLQNNMYDFGTRSFGNALGNIGQETKGNFMRNYFDLGGPLYTMGMAGEAGPATAFDLASRYLRTKEMEAQGKNKLTGISPASSINTLALGGDVQTHGGDFTTGISRIDSGGAHETNPNEGVQIGVDPEGNPNLVEEGEVVYNNFVYSNRIKLDEEAKRAFHFSRRKDLTYAEAAKKLEKEASERPNDPISQAALKEQMEELAQHQERQKQEMEAEKAQEEFASLSPEEQIAVMQQLQQQAQAPEGQEGMVSPEEQVAQEQAMQEQAMQEQAMAQQGGAPIPEEAMAMQQMMGGGQPVPQMSYGGTLFARGGNLFDIGGIGAFFRRRRPEVKIYDNDWYLNQAKSLGMLDQDATALNGFEFNPNDNEDNLTRFNNLYRDYQREKALETYRQGQRKAKENELFGPNGIYSYSDDKSRIYKARINDADRTGYINSTYKGGDEGFITPEVYNSLSLDEKEKYHPINEKAGNKMYDFYGNVIKDLQDGATKDSILDTYNYDDGFKWDPRDALTIDHPVEMQHSKTSDLRYVPPLGNLVSLSENVLSPADYSRPRKIEAASNYSPMFTATNYNPVYRKPASMDGYWLADNKLTADANGQNRLLGNTTSPSKWANTLMSGYNSMQARGNLLNNIFNAAEAKDAAVAAHNAAENKAIASYSAADQARNQAAFMQARQSGIQGTTTAAQMMENIDAQRAAIRNTNFNGLLQSLYNIGEEAYDEDRLKWLERTGVLRSNYFNTNRNGSIGKYGGKLRKKKGGKA